MSSNVDSSCGLVQSNKKSLKKNYIYNLIYQVLLIIVPIAVTPYITRVLLSDGIGKFSFTSSIVSYFGLMAAIGFNLYAPRVISKYRYDKHQQSISFWEISIIKLFTSILSLFLFYILVLLNVFDIKYKKLLLIQSISIIAVVFDMSFLLQGNEEFGKIAFRNIIIKIFSIISIFLFVRDYNDVNIYTFIQVTTVLISNISLGVYLPKMIAKVKFKELHPMKHLKPMLLLFIPTIAISIYTSLDKTLIGLITKDDSLIGNYDNAEKLVKMCITLISSLVTVFIPRNSFLYAEGKIDELKNNMNILCKFVLLIGLPMMMGTFVVSSDFMPLYLGEEYGLDNITNCITIMKILSILIPVIGLGTVLGGALLVPIGLDSKYTICIVCGAIFNFVLNLLFIRLYGSVGAALSTVIAESLVTILMIHYSKNYLNLSFIIKTAWKPIIASIIMLVICGLETIYISNSILKIFIVIISGVVSYTFILILLKEKTIVDLIKSVLLKLKNVKSK